MDSDEYQVTVKSANQKVDDYVTNCNPNWTVHQLKNHISTTHINRPNANDQRLIYAGNLLKDTHTLKQVFFRDSLCTELTNSSKTDFTIHLVCSQKSVTNQASINGQSIITPRRSHATSSATATLSNNSNSNQINANNVIINSVNNVTGSNDGLARDANTIGEFHTTLNDARMAEIAQSLFQSEQIRQQMTIFQQLARVVATQIADNLANNSNNHQDSSPASNWSTYNFTPLLNTLSPNVQNSTSSNDPSGLSLAQMFYSNVSQPGQNINSERQDTRPMIIQDDINNGQDNANVARAREPVVPQFGLEAPVAQPQMPAVDQPRAQAEADVPAELQRDVIDWAYYSIRAVVLMAALYIHASIFRLMFLLVLLGIAYFFNRRSARRNARVINNPQHAAHEVPIVDQPRMAAQRDGLRRRLNINNNNNQGEQRPIMEDDNRGQTGTISGPELANAGAERLPFLKLCYLVVTEFLASLVPE